MILTIISVLLVLMFISIFILNIKLKFIKNSKILYSMFLTIAIIICIFIILIIEGNSFDSKVMAYKRNQYIYMLENYDKLNDNQKNRLLDEIKEFNKEVDYRNNLWCRFNIEDRSEYYINAEDYI